MMQTREQFIARLQELSLAVGHAVSEVVTEERIYGSELLAVFGYLSAKIIRDIPVPEDREAMVEWLCESLRNGIRPIN